MTFDDLDPFIALLSSGNNALAVTLAWDAENRLSEYRPTFPAQTPNAQKVVLGYDYVGRRVEKKVYNWVGGQWSATPALHRKFVWGGTGGSSASGGWLMLLELEGGTGVPPVDTILRKYTWGLDLAGQNGGAASGSAGALSPALQGAGGIGGLLAMNEPVAASPDLDYVYFYDANGNVGELLNLAAATVQDAIVAHYEYHPYGQLTASAGTYAATNPFRFSTKYFDTETGLCYFGYRYYSPGLGRWLNPDPLGELGGANLYGYLGNLPVGAIDALGLQETQPAPLASTKTQASCTYRDTYGFYGGRAGTHHSERRWQKTAKCQKGAKRPEDCCTCCPPYKKSRKGGYAGTAYSSRTLVGAEWGPCCCCRVQVRRLDASGIGGPYWSYPLHVTVYAKCSDGTRWHFGHPEGTGDNIPTNVTDKVWIRAFTRVVYEACVSCDTAQKMLARAKSLKDAEYGLIQDCYSGVREVFHKQLADAVYCADECPTIDDH